MTATTLAERPSRTAEKPPRRELPVLFHLLDVSRGPEAQSRATTPPEFPEPQPADLLPTELEPKPFAELGVNRSATLPLEPPPIDEPPPVAGPNIETSPNELSLAANAATAARHELRCESPCEQQDELPIVADACEEAAVAPPDSPGELAHEIKPSGESATLLADEVFATLPEVAPPAASHPVRRGEQRRIRLQLPQDEWLTTHGKYIAIGFVLALLGTIYLARVNRSSSVPGDDLTAEAPSKGPAFDIPPVSTASSTQTETQATVARGTSERSPARLSEATSAQSQASLHPPTIPQLEPQPPRAASADENLFPWAKAEEHVANRPTQPTSVENHTLPRSEAAAPAGGPALEQGRATPSPAPWSPAQSAATPSAATHAAPTTPAYPNTGYPTDIPGPNVRSAPAAVPSLYGPYAPPAAQSPAPPPTQPGPQPHMPPAYGQQPQAYSQPAPAYPQQPPAYSQPPPAWNPPPSVYGDPSAAPGAAGTVPTYPLPDNSARGARYERTGSGLY